MSYLQGSQSESSRQRRREGGQAELRRVCFMYHCSISARKKQEKARLSGEERERKFREREKKKDKEGKEDREKRREATPAEVR